MVEILTSKPDSAVMAVTVDRDFLLNVFGAYAIAAKSLCAVIDYPLPADAGH